MAKGTSGISRADRDYKLYAVFKDGVFKEAAWAKVERYNTLDDADAYIRLCEKLYGLKGFTYSYGARAMAALPRNYVPRRYVRRSRS